MSVDSASTRSLRVGEPSPEGDSGAAQAGGALVGMVPAEGFGLVEDIDGGAEVVEDLVDEFRIDLGIEGIEGDLAQKGEQSSVARFLGGIAHGLFSE